MAELTSSQVLATSSTSLEKSQLEINELKNTLASLQQTIASLQTKLEDKRVKTFEIGIPWAGKETQVTANMKKLLTSLFNGEDWNILNIYFTPLYDWSTKTTAYYTLPLSEVYKMQDNGVADLYFVNDRHKWIISWDIQGNKLSYKTTGTEFEKGTAAIIIYYI